MMEIPYVNLSAQWKEERDQLFPIIESILESGQYVGSKEIEQLETTIEQSFSVKHAITLNLSLIHI